MGKSLTLSIILNIVLILFGLYALQKKGGINYLKIKFDQLRKNNIESSYNTKFYKARKSIFEIMPNRSNEIVFLGNSLTEFCNWNELFGVSKIRNRGISGDVINGVSNRLEQIVNSQPEKIFLMIGINDLAYNRSVNQILLDYENLVELILIKTPKTKIFLQSILPTKNRNNIRNNDVIQINTGILKLANKYSINYINLFDLFKTETNDLNMNLSYDGLHLNGQGYLIWKEAIIGFITD